MEGDWVGSLKSSGLRLSRDAYCALADAATASARDGRYRLDPKHLALALLDSSDASPTVEALRTWLTSHPGFGCDLIDPVLEKAAQTAAEEHVGELTAAHLWKALTQLRLISPLALARPSEGNPTDLVRP